MIEEDATICLTVSGAMTPVGFGGIFKSLIERGFVHHDWMVAALSAAVFFGTPPPSSMMPDFFDSCIAPCSNISRAISTLYVLPRSLCTARLSASDESFKVEYRGTSFVAHNKALLDAVHAVMSYLEHYKTLQS